MKYIRLYLSQSEKNTVCKRALQHLFSHTGLEPSYPQNKLRKFPH